MGNHEHESKHLSADGERQRNDEKHEKCHLCYKEHKDLYKLLLACALLTLREPRISISG